MQATPATKNLHICNGDKFTGPFVKLINTELVASEHTFFIADRKLAYPVGEFDNVIKVSDFRCRFGALANLISRMNAAELIVLHGLFGVMLYVLFLQPWLLKKVSWVIWGGDLYVHEAQNRGLRWRIEEVLRRVVISRVGYLQSWIEGDVGLARKWYAAKGRHVECLMYLSNVFEPVDLPSSDEANLTILVGNSADPTNHHIEVFDRLMAIDDGRFEVICPLSYGNEGYANYIAAEGLRRFGSRFLALLHFMDIVDYRRMLARTDIGIFAHRRQQGMGNTISMLGYGKKVYMRNDVTPWAAFKRKGVIVHALDSLSLDRPTSREVDWNKRIIREQFSKDVLLKQLRCMFKNDAPDAG